VWRLKRQPDWEWGDLTRTHAGEGMSVEADMDEVVARREKEIRRHAEHCLRQMAVNGDCGWKLNEWFRQQKEREAGEQLGVDMGAPDA
jgi:hypothetical protein